MFDFSYLKYNLIISTIVSVIVLLFLARGKDKYFLSKYTLSRLIVYLKKPSERILFRLCFSLKAVVDFGFYLFFYNKYNLSLTSVASISFLISLLLYFLMGIFTTDKHRTLHICLAGLAILTWALCQILLAILLGNILFLIASIVISYTAIVLSIWKIYKRSFNAYFEIFGLFLFFLWGLFFQFL